MGIGLIPPALTQEDLSRHGEALIESLQEMQDQQRRDLEAVVAKGIESGLRAILADEKLTEAFWRVGFNRLSGHAGDEASQWIGRRILTAAMVAALGLLVGWLVARGALK